MSAVDLDLDSQVLDFLRERGECAPDDIARKFFAGDLSATARRLADLKTEGRARSLWYGLQVGIRWVDTDARR